MKEKSFIRHTRPKGLREIKQTIKDIDRQVNYLKAIGGKEYDISFWENRKSLFEEMLKRIERNKVKK